MRIGDPRRVLLVAVVVAIALGFLFGWYARIWLEDSPESRIQDLAEGIRARVHRATH